MKRLAVLCLVLYCGIAASDNVFQIPIVHTSMSLVKTDSVGNVQWVKTYGGSKGNELVDVEITPDGGFIMTGTIYLEVEDTIFHSQHMQLVKTNSVGDLLWLREYEACDRDELGYMVETTSDSGYILLGKSLSGLVILKADTEGDLIWSRHYEEWNYPGSIQQVSDGGYVIVGAKAPLVNSEQQSRLDLWVMKIDSFGDSLWSRGYGKSRLKEIPWSIMQTVDRGYLIEGTKVYNGWDDFYEQRRVKLDSVGNMLLIDTTVVIRELPQNLKEILTKRLDEKGFRMESFSMKSFEGREYIVLCNVECKPPEEDIVLEQIRLIKMDNEGTILWNRVWQGKIEYLDDVKRTPDGGYLVIKKPFTIHYYNNFR